MPKLKRREPDLNQVAQDLVRRSTGVEISSISSVPDEQVRMIMREMGRRGGKKGGTVRAERMTKEQRSESASKAARVR